MRSIRTFPFALLVAVFAGCGDDSTGPEIDPNAISLAVGEVRTITSSEAAAVRVNGGSSGAEFTLVPVYAAVPGQSPIQLQFSGEQLTVPAGPPTPRVTAPTGVPSLATFSADIAKFQARLNHLERDALTPQFSAARSMYVGRGAAIRAASGVPEVGAQVSINTSIASLCSTQNLRGGRVTAVTQRAVIVADEGNPAGGFTDAEYAEMGASFDALVHPVITENFGSPSDIDANGERTVLFFTRAVNELTPAGSGGFITGFFFHRDLFSKSGPNACAGSNEAEVLYVWVPDPNGEVNGNVRTKAFVRTSMLGNLAHLSQYLVNISRRMLVNHASGLEEDWLLTGLSHIAEELVFYRASGLAPRQNITNQMLTASQAIADARDAYQVRNLQNLMSLLAEPESRSPYGDVSDLATRGAVWQFLRYAADRSATAEQTVWFNLANSQTTGIATVAAATGTDFFTLLRDWAMAQYADDAGFPVTSAFQHRSWNFRSVLPPMRDDGMFPLATRVLEIGNSLTMTLHAGSAAYLRFGVAAGRTGTIRVTQPGGSGTGSGAALTNVSLAMVRTK